MPRSPWKCRWGGGCAERGRPFCPDHAAILARIKRELEAEDEERKLNTPFRRSLRRDET